jgi:hypothetical protein
MPTEHTLTTGDDETAAAATIVQNLLGNMRAGTAMQQGLLSIIPLFPANEQIVKQTGFLPLADALQQGLLTITEQQQATVPELQATSTAETPIVMLSGEQVVGGLQNRVLNATILVAAKTVSHLPVTCVERGRWNPAYEARETTEATGAGSDQQSQTAQPLQRRSMELARMGRAQAFATEDAAYAGLRKQHMKSVSTTLAAGGGYQSDQGMVWGEVSARMAKTGSHSPTHAMRALYREPVRAEQLAQTVAALPRPDGALGFIVAIGNKIVGAEVFEDEALALAYWEKLARSYALDALDAEQSEKSSEATGTLDAAAGEHFLEQARTAKLSGYRSPGLGQDVRVTGKEVTGAGLVYGDAVVHLTLFAEEQPVAE